MTDHTHDDIQPVESEVGVLDLLKLVPVKAGHLVVMAIPVVVTIACLGVLITCTDASLLLQL